MLNYLNGNLLRLDFFLFFPPLMIYKVLNYLMCLSSKHTFISYLGLEYLNK